MLDVTTHTKDVGQLIFDVNGEYANNNLQDGNSSLYSAYRDRCLVYFLAKREINSRGKLLRFNFYEKTRQAFSIMCELLPQAISSSEYVRNLLNCSLPEFKKSPSDSDERATRKLCKIMLY